ncbi:hypothetical protein I7I51_03704 [Histoplasma capsulatum]|uniref:Uncharacterized protein n=1 Tax=Ajellomyces capsulatus TaxID=5037 RepID=A0A8A1M684_AJECA|nr:hypothetical protein I7I51_03704 [Histoplasma capsulatum]
MAREKFSSIKQVIQIQRSYSSAKPVNKNKQHSQASVEIRISGVMLINSVFFTRIRTWLRINLVVTGGDFEQNTAGPTETNPPAINPYRNIERLPLLRYFSQSAQSPGYHRQ